MRDIDQYFQSKDEPVKSCLLALRSYLLQYSPTLTETWKYRMPFYCYKGKMYCYLWTHKKYGQPYLGIVDGNLIDHPDLLPETRARMKILLIDPEADLPVDTLNELMQRMLKIRQ
ncbi:DUF1801 domain-containing protein [Chitinophaga horti]|uniref:DUF1801 domain-containing protein n=1 Tax=Chitinophaga horti TaxID=2920382 RepID=A0ABY6J4R0_9BACT|nr:DUF1801 domain-containing protein [Chitinophaga horti]UYQ94669.1 DUF1801 domain-containing protein [Chitinophaga horti]